MDRITKHYSIKHNSCDCHPETCNHWSYSLLKDGCIISQGDNIKDLDFPNKNIKYKILDFYGFENHKGSKEYKKWKRKDQNDRKRKKSSKKKK